MSALAVDRSGRGVRLSLVLTVTAGLLAAVSPGAALVTALALGSGFAALALSPVALANALVAASFLSGLVIPIGGFQVRPEQLAGALVFLGFLLRQRVRPFPRITLLVAAWVFLGALSAFGEPGASRALEHTLRLGATVLPVFLLPALLSPEEGERAWDGFLLLAVLEALVALVAFLSYFWFGTHWGVFEERFLLFAHPQGTLLEPNLLGALAAAAAVPLFLRVLAKDRSPFARLRDGLGLTLLLFAVAASVTRAAWLALPIALVFVFLAEAALFPWAHRARAVRPVLLVALSTVLLAGLVAFVILKTRSREGVAEKIASLARPRSDPNVRARLRTYAAAGRLVETAPFLGRGHGAMERIPGTEDRALAWAGNLEMHLLADTGLVGLALVLTFVGATLLRLRRAALRTNDGEKRRRLLERLGALLVLLLCAQATETTWLASFWALFGLALAANAAADAPSRRARTKLLYVHPSDELYGSDRVLLELVRRVPRDRFDPRVLLSSDVAYAGRLSRKLAELDVPVSRMRIGVLRRQVLASPLRFLRYLLDVARSTLAIARLLWHERVDIVHANTVTVFPAAFAAVLTGTRLVWHVHEIVTDRPGRTLLHGLVASLSDRLVVVSNAARASLGRMGRKAEVVPNGVEVRELGPPPSPPLVAYIGRIARRKGPDVFLRAATRVAARHPEVLFVIAGDEFGGEDLTNELKAAARRSPLEGRVSFQPFQEDVWLLFASASVVVSPSVLPESFGLVVLEAMAAGRPVVASRHGGPGELVSDGVTGFLVPPGDDAAMADAIARLVSDPTLSRDMGAAGRRRAHELFSLDAASRHFTALYDSLPR